MPYNSHLTTVGSPLQTPSPSIWAPRDPPRPSPLFTSCLFWPYNLSPSLVCLLKIPQIPPPLYPIFTPRVFSIPSLIISACKVYLQVSNSICFHCRHPSAGLYDSSPVESSALVFPYLSWFPFKPFFPQHPEETSWNITPSVSFLKKHDGDSPSPWGWTCYSCCGLQGSSVSSPSTLHLALHIPAGFLGLGLVC